jgi:2-polyprenyl-6-hydroxyphenyl methylase/3-demethylubiquinone-9 3-methyltransferase
MTSDAATNFDPAETAKFDRLARSWWDPDGPSRVLHDLNPVRLDYIASQVRLRGARVLDVGCGGGLLAEAMARAGARVTGIDLAPRVLDVARLHLHESGLEIDYRAIDAETLAGEAAGAFDVVACMELLEHVPDPSRLIDAIGVLLAPGGTAFFSTLNRTPLAFVTAILGAEYVLGLLPRGTHHYARFVRPAELAAALRSARLNLTDLKGIHYDPWRRHAALTPSVRVNYLACARKES